MKKLMLLLCFLVLTSQQIFAQYIDENFEYPAGAEITEWGWTTISGFGVNPIVVKYPGLEFPCYVGSGLGGTITLQTTGEDSYKFLTSIQNSGVVVVSFMVKVYTAQDGDFFFHLGDSVGNNSNKIGRIYAKASGGQIAFGLAKDNETPLYTPAVYSTDTDYLLVLKYLFVPGSSNDLVSLFVFEPPDCVPPVEPPANIGPLGVGEDDLPNLGKIVLQQGAGGHAAILQVDGIYIFDAWENGALPVELSAFSSSVNRRDVTLNWTTVSEMNNSGFEVERSMGNGQWSIIGNVSGHGTTTTSHNYSITDRGLSSGKYNYRLKQIDYNGNFEYFNLNNEVEIGTPSQFNLSQNYPNPFNPSTKINFDTPRDGIVSIKIFDNLGREVKTLINEFRAAGYHSVDFNAINLASGIYFYRIESNGFNKVMKMTLMK